MENVQNHLEKSCQLENIQRIHKIPRNILIRNVFTFLSWYFIASNHNTIEADF